MEMKTPLHKQALTEQKNPSKATTKASIQLHNKHKITNNHYL